jgi:hypothetical protein
MAHSRSELQSLINEAEADASREHYNFSETKTRVMSITPKGTKPCNNSPVALYSKPLGESTSETHIGIVRTDDARNQVTIASRIQVARRTAYALLGAGLHGLNGLCPTVSIHIWKTYITPRLTYGLESLVMGDGDIQQLESFYQKHIRALQHLPDSTAKPALYLLLGILPIEAVLHTRLLNFFMSIINRPASFEADIIKRQLAMKSKGSHSWTLYIQKTIRKYDLPSIYSLIETPPTKLAWKATVKSAVCHYWNLKLKEEAENMTTLSYLDTSQCSVEGKVHSNWQLGSKDPLTVYKASIKAKMLVQRYPIHSSRTSGRKYGTPCPLCSEPQEDLEHFLLNCAQLQEARKTPILRLTALLYEHSSNPDALDIVQVILDPHMLFGRSDLTMTIEQISRDLCYKLHHQRSILLGYKHKFTDTRQKGNRILG